MKKIIVLSLLAITPVFAVQEYYALSRSIRSLGMGGAFYGLSNDEHALFYNPAGLSTYKNDGQGMLDINTQMGSRTLSAISTIKNLGNSNLATTVNTLTQYQGDPLYAGVGLFPHYVRKHFGVGLLLADTKTDFLITGKELDSGVDLTAISDSGLVVGYGHSFFTENLHLGINAKGIYRAGGRKTFQLIEIAQNTTIKINQDELGGSGLGIDFDLGMMYELDNLPFGVANNFGVTFSNLLASKFAIARKGGTPPGLSRTLSFGWHTTLAGWSFIDNFHLLLDLAEFNLGGEMDADKGQRSGALMKHVNLGLEMPVGRLAVRLGVHQGYFTAGLGLNLTYARLELATYGEELGNAPGRLPSRRYALTLALGGGNAPTPAISSTREVPLQPEKKEETQKIKEPKQQNKIDPALELNDKPKAPTDPKAQPRSPQSIEEGNAAGSVEGDAELPATDVPGEKVIEPNP